MSPPVTLPADLHRPTYGTQTLADVLPGVATALGVPVVRNGLPPDPLGLTETLGGARRIGVLLVDGLGADLLEATGDADAVRALELALAGTSPYRDVAGGLHVLATRR